MPAVLLQAASRPQAARHAGPLLSFKDSQVTGIAP
jgi:hypothetical protein